jgi:hypothetical protein
VIACLRALAAQGSMNEIAAFFAPLSRLEGSTMP